MTSGTCDARDGAQLGRSAAGYGAADLVITLALLAILAGAVLPAAIGSLRTYERNGAARRLLAEIRAAQSEAVMRGAVIGLQWGADPSVNGSPSTYRIVRDTTGTCSFPAASAYEDGSTVIQGWNDLSDTYAGVRIESIEDSSSTTLGGVMFNAFGAAVNTCTSVSFPITVTVADADGATRSIEIRSAGGTRLQ